MKLSQSPLLFFIYALAFRFSSGRGRCFSPGGQAMIFYYKQRLRNFLLNRDVIKYILFRLRMF
ncbi:MAG TPA: hypothetical protein ENK78_00625 [Thiothrix sp.]|nr:hypothetical protein [Thiothrix sp.]